MKTATQYLQETFNQDNECNIRKRAICEDGFTVSIQGGTSFHYCEPKEFCNIYTEVELGFPSEEENNIMKYAEDPDDPTGTVYGYVPIEIVDAIICKHGGIIN